MRYSVVSSRPTKSFNKKQEIPVERKWIAKAKEYPGADDIPDPFTFSENWIKGLDIEEQFYELSHLGCTPGVRRRGNKWRVHINVATNIYEDASTIKAALRAALKSWASARRPTSNDKGVELWIQKQKRGDDIKYVKKWRIL